MNTHSTKIAFRLKKRMVKDTKNLITLEDYATQKRYTKNAIYYQIAKRRIIAFKIRGKWYISTGE